MLGFGALGESALGEGGDLSSKLFVTSGFSQPVRRAGLTAAVVATAVVGFVPPQVETAKAFTPFSQSPRGKLSAAVAATTSAGFIAPPAQAAPVFSSFLQPLSPRRVPQAEQPSWLFETAPLAIPFSGFMDFGAPRSLRYSFADQQTSMLFQVEFRPAIVEQGGGTSRKLDFSEPAADAPRRKKKTGLEPISKAETQPLIEPPKPALPLPPFEPEPETPFDERSPFDLVDPALIPQDLLGLQAQIHAAQAAYLDEQDARDIADIAALLDRLDEDEA